MIGGRVEVCLCVCVFSRTLSVVTPYVLVINVISTLAL